ncbi:MAG: ABC transporter ATP-binding protein [Clostridia bacterium]|nr:ABC transporter ATP-binding protein [Clostridia bacterium]
MSILKIEDLTYTYKSKYQTVKALKGITYEFEPGKFYALIGRSGSGKTTLLSLLAALDLPTEGQVTYEDKTTAEIDRDLYHRDTVAVIYQSYNLLPLLSVMENVTFPLELKKVPGARNIAEEKLRAVGLDETYFKRLPAMLSGGEQQRVAIARALASDAKIILADEPTGNLDTENSEIVIDLLQKLAHEEGYCVIVVTHDLSIADKADEVLRLKDGCLL